MPQRDPIRHGRRIENRIIAGAIIGALAIVGAAALVIIFHIFS